MTGERRTADCGSGGLQTTAAALVGLGGGGGAGGSAGPPCARVEGSDDQQRWWEAAAQRACSARVGEGAEPETLAAWLIRLRLGVTGRLGCLGVGDWGFRVSVEE